MDRDRINLEENSKDRQDLLRRISEENFEDCIQCGKCSAGCPASGTMDLLPHEVIRNIQLGKSSRIMKSETIWNCASCFTCGERCPREVDASRIIEACRMLLIRTSDLEEDRIDLNLLPDKFDEEIPQQALVSLFRKYAK